MLDAVAVYLELSEKECFSDHAGDCKDPFKPTGVMCTPAKDHETERHFIERTTLLNL